LIVVWRASIAVRAASIAAQAAATAAVHAAGAAGVATAASVRVGDAVAVAAEQSQALSKQLNGQLELFKAEAAAAASKATSDAVELAWHEAGKRLAERTAGLMANIAVLNERLAVEHARADAAEAARDGVVPPSMV
jgi:hypothetical protein